MERRILLIEDDRSTQLMYRTRLEDLGHEVVVSGTGAQGLLEARARLFDLFLVDIDLGSGIDGYEVCRRLKGMPQLNAIPAVLISGQVKGQEELHKGYEAGCEAYLMKGDVTLLEDVVRAMLRIKSLRDDLAVQNQLLEEQNQRLQKERRRGADLEHALRETGSRRMLFHELASGKADGLMLVDGDGVVRYLDRGASDILGKGLESRHLGSIAPESGLEAFVRDARTDAREGFRFDVPSRGGSTVRSLSATVVPMIPSSGDGRSELRAVLLLDAGRRRIAAEMLRLESHGVPRREIGPLLEAARRSFHPGSLVGRTPVMDEIRERLARFRSLDSPALIQGESGAGKSLLARILHFHGSASGAFVPVNCSAVAPQLLERELFGHEKGAFPEALSDRPGLFHQAHLGTLFLDEVGDLPAELQAKVLHFLESGDVMRMGSQRKDHLQVRILASSSSDLEALTQEGGFNKHLLYRLNAVDFRLPPLRERLADIEDLVQLFLQRHAAGRELVISPEALTVLRHHDWPGNVRELENLVEQACALTNGKQIGCAELPQSLQELQRRLIAEGRIEPQSSENSSGVVVARGSSLKKASTKPKPWESYEDEEAEPVSLQLYEKKALLRALKECEGDKLAAAKLLQIGKSTLYRKLNEHEI